MIDRGEMPGRGKFYYRMCELLMWSCDRTAVMSTLLHAINWIGLSTWCACLWLSNQLWTWEKSQKAKMVNGNDITKQQIRQLDCANKCFPDICKCRAIDSLVLKFVLCLIAVFTALHGMQTRSCDENSVRLSVCPSDAWIVIKRQKDLFRFLCDTKENLS